MPPMINRRQALAVSAGALLAGCNRSTGAGGALDQVTLMFDWVFDGPHAPFFYGIQTGIFRKHGISLTLLPGTGSRNTAMAAAAGHTTFGMVDATVIPQAVGQGAPIKAIYCYMPTTPFGICYKKSAGISKPADLAHHAYGDSPGAATYALWPLFLKKVGVDPTTVKLVDISPSSQWAAFRRGEFDATYTAMNNSYIKVHHAQPDAGAFAYADYGFNVLSKCVVANGSTLANGDMIARFTAAFSESVHAAEADIGAAVDALRRQVPLSTPREQQIEMLQDTVDKRIRSAGTRGKPLGWMPPADWRTVAAIVAGAAPGANPIDPDGLFTNAFIHA